MVPAEPLNGNGLPTDPGAVVGLQATLGGLPVDALDLHALPDASVAGPPEHHVQDPRRRLQHHLTATPQDHAAGHGRGGDELLGLGTVPVLVEDEAAHGRGVGDRDPAQASEQPADAALLLRLVVAGGGLLGSRIRAATAFRIPRSRKSTPRRSATRGPTTVPPAPWKAARVTTGRDGLNWGRPPVTRASSCRWDAGSSVAIASS
jgi:hypothetical protein